MIKDKKKVILLPVLYDFQDLFFHIFSCLDTLTNYPDVSISGNEEDTNKNVSAKSFSKEDYFFEKLFIRKKK